MRKELREKANAEKTSDKWLACRNFINLWLSDPTLYCNNCGMPFHAAHFRDSPCCDTPQVGRNFDHMKGLFDQNKRRREAQKNRYGSTDKKDMRVCVSIPARLLTDLERFFKQHGEKLWNDDKELKQFMVRFPEFRVPQET
jgi:hypothetical protein